MRARSRILTWSAVIGPTCSPLTSRCQGRFSKSAVGSGSVDPFTTMMWLHFLHRILKTLPRTLSSEIAYFVRQLSQTTFIDALLLHRRCSDRPPTRSPHFGDYHALLHGPPHVQPVSGRARVVLWW